jgi:hypothetical protein
MGLYDAMTNCQYSYLSTLHDICTIGTSSSSVNSFGEISGSTVYSGSMICGLHQNGGIKSVRGQYLATENDATLRLPIGTVIAVDNIICITSIYGSSASLVYRVNSEPKQGLAGTVVELKRVMT